MICAVACLFVLGVAVLVQERAPGGITDPKWVFGIDLSLFAVVVGFRTGKEMVSYRGTVNVALTGLCAVVFVGGLVAPLLL